MPPPAVGAGVVDGERPPDEAVPLGVAALLRGAIGLEPDGDEVFHPAVDEVVAGGEFAAFGAEAAAAVDTGPGVSEAGRAD